jgi:uncharacterized protein YndB with AHSA1/START domain
MHRSQPASARPRRIWRRLAGAFAVLASALAGGFLFLFTGSKVECAEVAHREGGPALRCAFDVAAPPAAVWQAFTTTEVSRPYYFDAVLQADLRAGGRWRFVTNDRERLLAFGEVLAVEPPHLFRHSFQAADLEDAPSLVTVEIEEAPGGSRLTLTHDGFGTKTATYRRFRRAHPLALSALASFVEDGELPLRTRLYTLLFEPGMKIFTVRAEPWQ